ncbi:MAG: 8-oxo-dGTP diphosphatase [Candidatus Komeilibacteria bacterium]|nr:8-oxo-dGTP diphosphatase [Candidatus Komeilibacteria bacterium]
MKKILTLCIVHQGGKVLLGMKKRGFGAGRWNGFGGKVHEGETVEQAASRELLEEADIVAQILEPRGTLCFNFANEPDELKVSLFCIKEFSGEPKESEEMKPQWFNVDEIPFGKMWPDDIYWLPLFLEGKNLHGQFNFKDHDTLLDYKVNVIPTV